MNGVRMFHSKEDLEKLLAGMTEIMDKFGYTNQDVNDDWHRIVKELETALGIKHSYDGVYEGQFEPGHTEWIFQRWMK